MIGNDVENYDTDIIDQLRYFYVFFFFMTIKGSVHLC
jgi:hypothetical protein